MSHQSLLSSIKAALFGGNLTSELVAQVENLNLPQHLWQDFKVKGNSPEHLKLSLLCLVKSGRSFSLDSILEQYNLPDPKIQILLAYCLVGAGHTQRANNLLKAVPAPNHLRYLFWYWLTTALIATHTKATTCFDAYTKAIHLCSGHEKGMVYLNLGAAFESFGDVNAAISSWRTALTHLELPSYALALCHYNLGQALLSLANPEASDQFNKALDVARYACAKNIKSTALCGLGDCKRLFGVLPEAQHLYTRALGIAKKHNNKQDQINAHAKLGYIATLRNDIDSAFEQLDKAIALIPDEYSNTWVYTIQALFFLKQYKQENASQALAHAIALGNIATERKKILLAELERQNGNLEAAKIHYLTANLENVGARELLSVLPEIFAWAEKEGLPLPVPIRLERRISVQTLGAASVFLNGEKITLSIRAFEILVYFLNYRTRSVNEAVKALYFEELELQKKSFESQLANFHKNIERLRIAFLWDSILAVGKNTEENPEVGEKNAYTIGTDAVWELDWIGVSKSRLQAQFLSAPSNKTLAYRERAWVKDILEFF
jgi:tetratricopeptide (TPR) repeat protein